MTDALTGQTALTTQAWRAGGFRLAYRHIPTYIASHVV
jgi:hypothetical protein